MRGFTLKEKEQLIKMAKDSKLKGYSLTRVFNDFAKETKRASGSVRNYYYELVKEENLESLQVNEILPFTKCDTIKLIAEILQKAGSGKSIRRVIGEIAPDEKVALRYQNKYRNVIKRERELVEEIMQGLESKGVEYFNPYKRQKEKRNFAYNRLKVEIDGLLERLNGKEKQLNKQLLSKIALLEEENQALKEKSKILNYYKSTKAKKSDTSAE